MRGGREALHRSGGDGVLGGRSEGFLVGQTDIDATIKRLVAYADAGADCLYAPGIRTCVEAAAIVAAVAPKPVNVLLMGPEMRIADLAEAGVRRGGGRGWGCGAGGGGV